MRKTYTALTLGALALGLVAAPLVAHHAFGAEFDKDAPLRLEGQIVKLEWVNPHSWIHLEIEGEDVLLRRGLTRDCLSPGTVLIGDGYQAKDHSLKRANGRDVTFTDGTKMFMGSSGTGAPGDAERLAARQARGRC